MQLVIVQIPQTINYQEVSYDTTGDSLAHGDNSFHFSVLPKVRAGCWRGCVHGGTGGEQPEVPTSVRTRPRTCVLVASEPVAVLNLGLVAKIYMSEIRVHFLRTGGLVGILTALMVVLRVILFARISQFYACYLW